MGRKQKDDQYIFRKLLRRYNSKEGLMVGGLGVATRQGGDIQLKVGPRRWVTCSCSVHSLLIDCILSEIEPSTYTPKLVQQRVRL